MMCQISDRLVLHGNMSRLFQVGCVFMSACGTLACVQFKVGLRLHVFLYQIMACLIQGRVAFTCVPVPDSVVSNSREGCVYMCSCTILWRVL